MRHRCVARAAGVPVNAPGSDVNDYRLHHITHLSAVHCPLVFDLLTDVHMLLHLPPWPV